MPHAWQQHHMEETTCTRRTGADTSCVKAGSDIKVLPYCVAAGSWVTSKAIKDRLLRVFVRHLDYDSFTLDHGVRLFVAERTRGAAMSSSSTSTSCRSGCGMHSSSGGSASGSAAADGNTDVESGSSSSSSSVLEGFVLLDPMYNAGSVYGYVMSICRMRTGAHTGM